MNLGRCNLKLILPEWHQTPDLEADTGLALRVDRLDASDHVTSPNKEQSTHDTHRYTDTAKQRLLPHRQDGDGVSEDGVGVVDRIGEAECRQAVCTEVIATLRVRLE